MDLVPQTFRSQPDKSVQESRIIETESGRELPEAEGSASREDARRAAERGRAEKGSRPMHFKTKENKLLSDCSPGSKRPWENDTDRLRVKLVVDRTWLAGRREFSAQRELASMLRERFSTWDGGRPGPFQHPLNVKRGVYDHPGPHPLPEIAFVNPKEGPSTKESIGHVAGCCFGGGGGGGCEGGGGCANSRSAIPWWIHHPDLQDVLPCY